MKTAVRRATPSDASTIAAITIEGWNEPYKGLIAQETLNQMSLEKRTEGWTKVLEEGKSQVIVATVGETVTGFSNFGPSRYEQLGAGEIYAFYVLKSCQRQGVGKLLIEESLKKLSQMNHLPPIVLTLKGNTSAEEFYKKRGVQACGEAVNQIEGRDYVEIVCRCNSL